MHRMRITVTVKPSSKQTSVEPIDGRSYVVRVNAPAREGKANRAAIKALAEFFDIAPSRISLIRGESAKHKTFDIV